MNSLFLLTYALLWLIVGVLVYLVLHLQKKVQGQAAGAAPKNNGPILFEEHHGIPKGHPFPAYSFTTYDHKPIALEATGQQLGTLVAFTSVECNSCNSLYGHLQAFISRNPKYQILILMDGSLEQIRMKVESFRIPFPVVPYTPEDKERYQTRITPFVYFINRTGKIVTKSVINYEDQLDLLVSKRLDDEAA